MGDLISKPDGKSWTYMDAYPSRCANCGKKLYVMAHVGKDPPHYCWECGAEKDPIKELVTVTHGTIETHGTITNTRPGDSLTITGDLAIAGNLPKPTLRQRIRWGLRELADCTLVPLGLMHYSGCWCERCRNRFYNRIDKESE